MSHGCWWFIIHKAAGLRYSAGETLAIQHPVMSLPGGTNIPATLFLVRPKKGSTCLTTV